MDGGLYRGATGFDASMRVRRYQENLGRILINQAPARCVSSVYLIDETRESPIKLVEVYAFMSISAAILLARRA